MTSSDPNSAAAVSQEPDLELRCPACDYDLRGIGSDRCPECGLAFDRAALSQSQIPWAHRASIGRIRAYWRTVRWVIRGGRAAALEVGRPVSHRDAVLFQRITVALAFLPLAALGLWQYISILPNQRDGSWLGWMLEYVGVGVIALCLWLFLTTATTAAGYFFHPHWLPMVRQNRAIAISHYACAPLSFAPIVAAAIGMLTLIELSYWSPPNIRARSESLIGLLAGLLIAAIIIGWWWRTLTLLRRTTKCGMDRLFALAAYMPVAWTILATIFLGILPLAYLATALMILSAAGH